MNLEAVKINEAAGFEVHSFERPKASLREKTDGLWLHVGKTKKSAPYKIKVLTHPITCTALVFDDSRTVCGRILRLFNEFKKEYVDVLCESASLNRTDVFERFLVDNGVGVAIDEPILAARSAASVLRAYVISARPQDHVHLTNRTGWSAGNEVYFLGQEALAPGEGQMPVESKSIRTLPRRIVLSFSQGGSIQDWFSNCCKPALKNPVWVTCILTAFAAPLLNLFDLQDHGGGFHFYGHSSTGKTIGQKLAASVYGQEVLPWLTTSNGVEGLAALHSDRVLLLDEIKQANPRDVMKSIYMLANRRGKFRMNDKAELKASSAWQLLTLSSGEISLEDCAAMARSEYYEGQALRMLSIPMIKVDAELEEVKKLEAATATYRGVVGRAWLNYLLRNHPEKIGEWVKQFHKTRKCYLAHWDSKDPRFNRLLQRFALLDVAGQIAQANGFLPEAFKPHEDTSLSQMSLNLVINSWCEGAGVEPDQIIISDTRKAAKRLIQSVYAGIANRQLIPFAGNEFTAAPGSKTLGFIDETFPAKKEVFLLDSILKESCIPPGVRTFTKDLSVAGVIVRDSKNSKRLKTRLHTVSGFGFKVDSSIQAYRFDLNKLETYANA